jgi:hypothetical protein
MVLTCRYPTHCVGHQSTRHGTCCPWQTSHCRHQSTLHSAKTPRSAPHGCRVRKETQQVDKASTAGNQGKHTKPGMLQAVYGMIVGTHLKVYTPWPSMRSLRNSPCAHMRAQPITVTAKLGCGHREGWLHALLRCRCLAPPTHLIHIPIHKHVHAIPFLARPNIPALQRAVHSL